MPAAFVRGLIAAGVTAGVVLGYSTITGLDGGTALLALDVGAQAARNQERRATTRC